MIDVNKCDDCNFYGCEELQMLKSKLKYTLEEKANIETLCKKHLAETINMQNELDAYKKENKQLKEWREANRATGICETCTEKSVMELDKLRQENEQLKNKLNSFKRLQAEVNIKSKKLEKIKKIVIKNSSCNNCNKKYCENCQDEQYFEVLQILERC